MTVAVSEQVLRKRLSGKRTEEEIEELIDRYVEAASLEGVPDMEAISELAQKGQEERLLRVSFRLDGEQYDALAAYFGEDQRPGTILVRRAVEELISLIN